MNMRLSSVCLFLGLILISCGSYSQDSESTNPILKHAERLTKRECYVEAACIYDNYLQRHPDHDEVLIDYADIVRVLGNYNYAMHLMNCYKDVFGPSQEYWMVVARILSDAGFYESALCINNKLRCTYPKESYIIATQASALFQANRRCEALAEYQYLIRLDPKSDDIDSLYDSICLALASSITLGSVYADLTESENIMEPLNLNQYINQSDSVRITRIPLMGKFYINPNTALLSIVQYENLRAGIGTDLETIDGRSEISDTEFFLGIRHLICPTFEVQALIGDLQISDRYNSLVFNLTSEFTFNERVTFYLQLLHDLYRPVDLTNGSPRSVSLHIMETCARSHVIVKTGYQSGSDIDLRVSKLSDGNSYWRVAFAPGMNIYNSNKISLDIGLDTELDSFSKPSLGDFNGYYSPHLYQLYEFVAVVSFTPEKDLLLQLYGASGITKDENTRVYRFATDFGGQVKQRIGKKIDLVASVSYLYRGLEPVSYHELDISVGITWRFFDDDRKCFTTHQKTMPIPHMDESILSIPKGNKTRQPVPAHLIN